MYYWIRVKMSNKCVTNHVMKWDLVEKVIHDEIRLDDKNKPINNGVLTIDVYDIINADSEYSQWSDRDDM